jgi:hypothetical protein
MDRQRDIKLKVTIIWLAILLLGSFWFTVRTGSDPVSLAVTPEFPREDEPIVATFKLNNPTSRTVSADYEFSANGELLKSGTATIAPGSSKVYQYAYKNPLELGERINFVVKTVFPQGSYDEAVSLPSYPPQVWLSFVSFASFSTSVMSSMTTTTYYNSTFGNDMGFNVGVLTSLVLIVLLIFLELTPPALQGKTLTVLEKLRIRFGTLTWILFMIFMGIVYTKVLMVMYT